MIKSNCSSFNSTKLNDFICEAFEVTSSYLSKKLTDLEISDITTKASLQNLKESLQLLSNELNELINEEKSEIAEKKELSLSDLIKNINIEKINNVKKTMHMNNYKSKSLEKNVILPNSVNFKYNQDFVSDKIDKRDVSPPKTNQILSKTQNLASIKEEKGNKTLKKEISKKQIQKDLYIKYFSNPSNDKKLNSLISGSQTTRGKDIIDKNEKNTEEKRSRRNLENREERKNIPKIIITSASCDTRSKSLNNKFLNYYYFFDKNCNKSEN